MTCDPDLMEIGEVKIFGCKFRSEFKKNGTWVCWYFLSSQTWSSNDPQTPIEETARALDGIVKSGKALYVGISNYDKEQTIEIAKIFKKLGTQFIINQRKYSIFERKIEEDGLKDYAKDNVIEIWAI